jgi:hypothetical protein
MVACLGCEATWLLANGFPYSAVPFHVYAMAGVWICACVCTILYAKLPILTLLAGWWWLIANSTITWFYPNEEKSLEWLLYLNSFELLFIAASHTGYFLVLRKRSPRET